MRSHTVTRLLIAALGICIIGILKDEDTNLLWMSLILGVFFVLGVFTEHRD